MQTVKDVMHPGIELVTAETKLTMAAQKMADNNIGFLAVGEGSQVTGCLTDRDLVIKCIARGMDPNEHRVEDVMNRNVITIEQNKKMKDAESLMQTNRVRRLIVVNEDRIPVGVLSLGDVATKATEEEAGKVYHHIAWDLQERRTS